MTQIKTSVNNFLKFYYKFGIGFQINLGVLLWARAFQIRSPILENNYEGYLKF